MRPGWYWSTMTPRPGVSLTRPSRRRGSLSSERATPWRQAWDVARPPARSRAHGPEAAGWKRDRGHPTDQTERALRPGAAAHGLRWRAPLPERPCGGGVRLLGQGLPCVAHSGHGHERGHVVSSSPTREHRTSNSDRRREIAHPLEIWLQEIFECAPELSVGGA